MVTPCSGRSYKVYIKILIFNQYNIDHIRNEHCEVIHLEELEYYLCDTLLFLIVYVNIAIRGSEFLCQRGKQ